MIKIKAETIAYHNPTRVTCNNIVIETQNLNIEELCDLWKWYFRIPPFEKVVLVCNSKLYNSLSQRLLYSHKSVIELFAEQGIEVVEDEQD